MTKTVAVTGATGFIGAHLVRALSAPEFVVRCLARDPEQLRDMPGGAEVVAGSLQDEAAVGRLMRGASSVIHLAGAICGRNRQAFHSVNVDGAKVCARLARDAGVGRFVHVSSLAAREPQLSDYAASKRASEAAVQAEAGDMSWVIVRPPAVYGPGDRGTLPLISQLTKSKALVPANPAARMSLLYVSDLVNALVRLCMVREPEGSIHEMDDGTPGGYNWSDLAGTASQVLGYPVTVRFLPKQVVSAAAYGALAWTKISGQASVFGPGKVRELYHRDWVARMAPLHAHLDWSPQTGFADGFATTLEWYVKNGWLPPVRYGDRTLHGVNHGENAA